jgi:hypothetical protein
MDELMSGSDVTLPCDASHKIKTSRESNAMTGESREGNYLPENTLQLENGLHRRSFAR